MTAIRTVMDCICIHYAARRIWTLR